LCSIEEILNTYLDRVFTFSNSYSGTLSLEAFLRAVGVSFDPQSQFIAVLGEVMYILEAKKLDNQGIKCTSLG